MHFRLTIWTMNQWNNNHSGLCRNMATEMMIKSCSRILELDVRRVVSILVDWTSTQVNSLSGRFQSLVYYQTLYCPQIVVQLLVCAGKLHWFLIDNLDVWFEVLTTFSGNCCASSRLTSPLPCGSTGNDGWLAGASGGSQMTSSEGYMVSDPQNDRWSHEGFMLHLKD